MISLKIANLINDQVNAIYGRIEYAHVFKPMFWKRVLSNWNFKSLLNLVRFTNCVLFYFRRLVDRKFDDFKVSIHFQLFVF